jgi:Histidine kinase
MDGQDLPRLMPALRASRAWLAQTFAGLTWGRMAIVCFALYVYAMSRGPVAMAVLDGKGVAAAASASVGPMAVVFGKFIPMLVVVIAAANRAPREGWPRVAWLAGALVLGALLGTGLAAFALSIVAPEGFYARALGLHQSPATLAVRWFGGTLGDLAIAATATAFWYYLRRNADAAAALYQAQHDSEETQRESAEARLQVLQAQIEPHFLFNTLASIRRLYETEPDSGRTMLRHLVSYLTASLPTLRAAHSTLGRELALATAYLNVQKIRMGARLGVEIDVPLALHEIEVPPMMLATLAENAIIHGLGPLPEGGRIRIVARAKDGRLTVQVADDGRGLQDAWGAGIGLANIRARLHSEFRDNANVTLASGPQRGVTATIDLPLPADMHALAA